MHDNIQNILSRLPHSPGVYQYFNSKWELLYVGKSKNLKARVGSYFSGTQKLNFAKKKMVSHITDIQYIVTNNEVESLILENDLIKKHQPKYNILLKDGKNFLYIKITKEKYPKVIRTRISPSQVKKSDGKYFWPYISGFHVWEIFKILKKIFWYGVWEHNFFLGKNAYSLDKYIFDGNIRWNEAEIHALYHAKISEISDLLSGNTWALKDKLRKEMLERSQELKFELAQRHKVALEALETLEDNQIVRDGVKWNYFIIQVLTKYEGYYLWVIEILEGKIVWYENMELENRLKNSEDEILKNTIEQKWVEHRDRKGLKFIIPRAIPELNSQIHTEIPELWSKYELLKLCYKNIYEYAHKKYIDSLSVKWFTKKNMLHLLEHLGYSAINKDIIFECNDISHLSGNHSVASRSIIENGEKNPKKYKKFRIKTLQEWKIDDFASMREIMLRRVKELEKLWNYPDLIVIDGWKWQLWAVLEILSKHTDVLEKLQIVSIAKREEELFLPWNPKAVILEKDSPELRMIQTLRDEAHRFAITFNRDSRSNAQKKNILEAIPGIGPKLRKKILTQFGSIWGLQKASKEDIESKLWKSLTEKLELHGLID